MRFIFVCAVRKCVYVKDGNTNDSYIFQIISQMDSIVFISFGSYIKFCNNIWSNAKKCTCDDNDDDDDSNDADVNICNYVPRLLLPLSPMSLFRTACAAAAAVVVSPLLLFLFVLPGIVFISIASNCHRIATW